MLGNPQSLVMLLEFALDLSSKRFPFFHDLGMFRGIEASGFDKPVDEHARS